MPALASRAMSQPDPVLGAPHYTASPTLSFCILGETVIVLDIETDRYFALGPRRGEQILANLAGKEENPRPHVPGTALTGDRFAGAVYVDRHQFELPTRDYSSSSKHGALVLAKERWRATCLYLAALVIVKFGGFARSLRWATLRAKSGSAVRRAQAEAVIDAHRWARSLLPFNGTCLPASLALVRGLAGVGAPYVLVVGVKLGPFAAHCWVEDGGAVLNDDLETVRQFTPIRFVRDAAP
ncbi:lasso peptide biosynthesis B2 protein [Novosphingobium sp. G106]|uniref:lasso peptide biosynthesis B2 protein n=1 Tax=Novosphingobium sp. G106 TaxID=2849500 RepID=UPI001C2D64FD|nr:lasso peptide biosynthesis B2 protein [Novosphingobium sp. G106]MBV1687719.1 lasso peptide biosynthesis B2 protein [Novosphingobium sp. G106]